MNFIKVNYFNQFIKTLMSIVRVLIIISISLLIIASLLMIIFGMFNETAYGIMWFSIMCSALVYYFSILALIGVVIYYKIKNEKAWGIIKNEIMLFGISILCFLILGLINNYFL